MQSNILATSRDELLKKKNRSQSSAREQYQTPDRIEQYSTLQYSLGARRNSHKGGGGNPKKALHMEKEVTERPPINRKT